MKTRLLSALALMAFLAVGSMSVQSTIPDDADNDGVPDSVDACPVEDASFFDRDGDGCIDPDGGARHTEYWGVDDATITYVINDAGSPNVGDGSDFTAIQDAVNAWQAVLGTELTMTYGGTTAQEDANALDQVNLVTWLDDQYPFSSLVLAVGVSTSFTTATDYNGRLYRPGEIVDVDMIFNPSKAFKTSTAGPGFGTDIQSVATHEAGHLWGLAHTAIRSATMYYVLPAGTAARSLESDDQLAYLKAYADAATRAGANRIAGVVTDGQSQLPVPGAIVFATDAATGDTAACDFTLPDGSYTFMGLPDGDYYVSIYPLNGTSPIGYIQPGNINALVETTAVDVLVPEYWDAAESNVDNAADKTAINVSGGGTATADLVTNIDATAPAVTSAIPPDDSVGVAIDGAYVIRFSEAIDPNTLQASFRFTRIPDGAGVGGNISVLNDDSLIAFAPNGPLEFSTDYQLTLDTLLTDQFGNRLASKYVLDVTTEVEPPLSISSLSPNKGVVGTTVVINGKGFDVFPPAIVTFDTALATVTTALPNQLVVTVPSNAATGPVTVTNPSDASTSNPLTFTLLSSVEIARGYETGVVTFASTPTSMALLPDDSYAYVGTENGAEAVVIDAGAAGYLTSEGIPYEGGLDGMATTPEGRRVYGVSKVNQEIVEIVSDTSAGFLFNTILSSHDVGAQPLGIVIEPGGRRAYVPTDEAEIQVWDVQLGSATYQHQVGTIPSPDAVSLRGQMALTPDGAHLLALTDGGDLLVFDAGPDTLLQTVPVGIAPRDVIVDPQGGRAYVSHDNGDVSIVALRFESSPSFQVLDIAAGSELRGMDITPAGNYIYATDRALDEGKIIDLDEGSPTWRSVIADFPLVDNPVAIELSSDGVYGFSLLQGSSQISPRMTVTTIGLGPALVAVAPRAGRPGDVVVLSGQELGDLHNIISIDFTGDGTSPSEIYDGLKLVSSVPAAASTGPVSVSKVADTPPYPTSTSNEVYFKVLGPSPPGGMRFAGELGIDPGSTLEETIAISPLGDLAFVGGTDGEVQIFSIDPTSPDFHQNIRTVDVFDPGPVSDLAVTADGKYLFVVSNTSPDVKVLSALRSAHDFGKYVTPVLGMVTSNPNLVVTSPDNQWVLVYDSVADWVNIINATGMYRGNTPTQVDYVTLSQVYSMVIHPSGTRAYLAQVNPNHIWVLDLDTRGPNFGQLIDNEPMPPDGIAPAGYSPLGMDITPDGSRLLIDAVNLNGVPAVEIFEFSTPTPAPDDTIAVANIWQFGQASSTPSWGWPIRVSPRGDRVVWEMESFGIVCSERTALNDTVSVSGLFESLVPLDMEFTPDGSRVYVASTFHDAVRVYDFVQAQTLDIVSGNFQSGVAGQTLAAPLRVRVSTTAGGESLEGIALEFTTTDGGFVTTSGTKQNLVVATDEDGYAEATWIIDSAVGLKVAQVLAPGLTGSPVAFEATATDDPATLPLEISQVIPLNGTGNHSVTTAVQATFSRGVEPSTVDETTFYMERQSDASPVPAAVGFTDNNRKVSLTPLGPLSYGETYEVHYTAAIEDTSTGTLTNPGMTSFATQQAPPPPAISALNPPSGVAGIYVTISGTGFDPVPGNNTVLFNGASAVPIGGSVDYLKVKVPQAAITGSVFVATSSDTSNAKPFTVLVPSVSPIDDVLATIGVGGGTKTLAVTPDGAIAYTVNTAGDVVIPIAVDSLTSLPSIPVGDQPVAIAIHPEGTYAYVANFGSNSLSIIDISGGAAVPNPPVTSLLVGTNPIDVVATDDRVIVANAGSSDISVVDGDSSSTTHHSVLATIGVGGGAKSLAVTPDGTMLYVLTNNGEVVVYNIEPGTPGENSVLATIGVGGGAKSLAVSPDGTLLYLVQENTDEILVVEVAIVGGTSVIGDDVTAPQYTLSFTVKDTIPTGQDPSAIAFDPSGSGVAVITQAGENDVKVLNASPFPQGTLAVDVEVRPHTLQLDSKGRYVTGYVEFPLAYSPHEVDVSTVLLQDTIPAEEDKVEFRDTDGDNADDQIVLKFDRGMFQDVLPQGEYVPVSITGWIRDRDFAGTDTIRTIRPTVTSPYAGQDIKPTSVVTVEWTSPLGYNVHHVDVDYSVDDGATWAPVAAAIPDYGYVAWQTPSAISRQCRILVTLFEDEETVLGMGMSDEFSLALPVSVALANFDATLQEGTALVRWRTGLEIGMVGFHLSRSNEADGDYARVTEEMIPARGGVDGAAYEYRDETVRPNHTYYYKLEEIAETGPGLVFGPYEVSYRLSNGLAQNVPNPFNPTTAIRFSIASDELVSLVVYDVAGRRVRTLVNERRRADIYKVIWDGRNDQGQRVASGVYFYRLQAGKFTKTLKMLLLK